MVQLITVDKKMITLTVELSSTSQDKHGLTHHHCWHLEYSGVHRMGVCLEPVSILQDLEFFPTSLADPDSWRWAQEFWDFHRRHPDVLSLGVFRCLWIF
jgi:hypothetical protein